MLPHLECICAYDSGYMYSVWHDVRGTFLAGDTPGTLTLIDEIDTERRQRRPTDSPKLSEALKVAKNFEN